MRLLAALALAAAHVLAACGAPIHKAARNNDAAAVRALAASGADLNAYNDPVDKWTPVEMAAFGGHKEALQALLDAGARPELGRHRSDVARRHPELIALVEARAGTAAAAAAPKGRAAPSARALHKAVLEDSTARAAAELDKGVDIEEYREGLTPLMSAAMNGSAGMVRFLLSRGANPHLVSQYKKRTALEGMAFSNRDRSEAEKQEIASLLREAMGPSPAAPGNLDDAAYARMRASAGLPPETKEPVSEVDLPKGRAAERPDDFALVIGIEDYQSVPKADWGVRDAVAVRRHLEARGIPARNVVHLVGSQATGNKLKSYLEEWLPLNVKPTSTLYVYYSGHGAPDPKTGEAYLMPWDGDPQFLKSTALPLRKLYSDLEKTKAKRVIVALDACFSGAGGRSVLAEGARPLVSKAADVKAGERVTVLAAASGDEITGSLKDQGHGMFTYFLLKGLAAGKTSARELMDYVTPNVQDEARRQNRQQTPALFGADASF